MKISAMFLSLLILLSFMPILNPANAEPSVSIETSQSIYHYGEYLTITINVSEVTGDFATIYIIDSSQKKSILLKPPISQKLLRSLQHILLILLYGSLVRIS